MNIKTNLTPIEQKMAYGIKSVIGDITDLMNESFINQKLERKKGDPRKLYYSISDYGLRLSDLPTKKEVIRNKIHKKDNEKKKNIIIYLLIIQILKRKKLIICSIVLLDLK